MSHTEPFFPLRSNSQYKLTLNPIHDEMCNCGHKGLQHLSHGNRTCLVSDCSCSGYEKYNPKYKNKEDFHLQAEKYFKQAENMLEIVRWVFENLKFFRNYDDTELGWAWGKYVLNYDPYSEFMTQDIMNKIKKYGSHSVIERKARRLREECRSKNHPDCKKKTHEQCSHECDYCPFDPELIETKQQKEYGIWGFYSENKID